MRWFPKRHVSNDYLVLSWSRETLAYVIARPSADGAYEVIKFGVERQTANGREDLLRRLRALEFKGLEVRVMLRPDQNQFLQINAPAVAPEELRSAARYQIREMLDTPVADVTLDVMGVGDGRQNGSGQIFVVATSNTVVREISDLCAAMHWTISVIDIQETAQRNLQSALAARDDSANRANAALVLIAGQQALLTISANEELFYTRRIDISEGFLAESWGQGGYDPSDGVDTIMPFTPVDEYVPGYSVGNVSYDNDYTDTSPMSLTPAASSKDDDNKAQRFLVEVRRSLDLWGRSWSGMPLNGVRVYAGARSEELANWLAGRLGLGHEVLPMNVNALFPGFEGGAVGDQELCLPLLGILLRTKSQKL